MKFKDARRTSFTIGDKVKILPSAVDIGVHPIEVGKQGVITKIDTSWGEIAVLMNKPCTINGFTHCRSWYTESTHIELVVIVGQQLLFEFMG